MIGNKNIKYAMLLASFIIVAAILYSSYEFSMKLKDNERSKMEILAKAYDRFGAADLNQDFSLEATIIESNNNIPMIVTDENGEILMKRNLDSVKALDTQYLEFQLTLMKAENKPIVINYLRGKKYIIYYKNSDLLTRLQYYPILLVLILVLFSMVIYLMLKSNTVADQNKLWTGMAKETAHQIGTPLSSLLGWIEMMKIQQVSDEIVNEVTKDVNKLHTIADRFSKIGSVPEKTLEDIIPIISSTLSYFKARSAKQLSYVFEKELEEVELYISNQLFTWVLENMIKNAIDAMGGKGVLTVHLTTNAKKVIIAIGDTGKGIPKKMFKKIFTPGFTTKKRGWGLGLSLSKRIVEDYHNGKVFVKKSEIQKGTVMEIQLPFKG